MKVLHIESGLGNQMLGYVEYLAMKESNPEDECFIETIIYEIPECHDTICQWNGYELERIFGIDAPNIKSLFDEEQWNRIINRISQSKFWKENWNYPPYITEVLNEEGLNLINNCKSLDLPMPSSTAREKIRKKMANFFKTYPGYHIKRYLKKAFYRKKFTMKKNLDALFYSTDKNLYCGFTLGFRFKNSSIEKLDKIIRNTFKFKPFTDQLNLDMSKFIKGSNSIAIHARRGDMLSINGYCYKYGYFKRAIRFIKGHVDNPVFIFFCDSGSINWCKENRKVFGLDFSKDVVYFVDWNKGEESYRDMQLMAMCKHNIITNSSFGWWGAYLNENPNKITCSPEIAINTTHTF